MTSHLTNQTSSMIHKPDESIRLMCRNTLSGPSPKERATETLVTLASMVTFVCPALMFAMRVGVLGVEFLRGDSFNSEFDMV